MLVICNAGINATSSVESPSVVNKQEGMDVAVNLANAIQMRLGDLFARDLSGRNPLA